MSIDRGSNAPIPDELPNGEHYTSAFSREGPEGNGPDVDAIPASLAPMSDRKRKSFNSSPDGPSFPYDPDETDEDNPGPDESFHKERRKVIDDYMRDWEDGKRPKWPCMPKHFNEYGATLYGGDPFSNQTLPSFYLYMSHCSIIPVFFVVAIVMIVIGAVVIHYGGVYTVEVYYNDISKYQYIPTDPAVNINQGIRKFMVNGVQHSQGTLTEVPFTITKTMVAPVYLYYRLKNFYQNHRDFHDGRQVHQIRHGSFSASSTYVCKPFEKPGFLSDQLSDVVTVQLPTGGTRTIRFDDFLYNPCGLAAWSMFNDTFSLYKVSGTTKELICNSSDFDYVGNPLSRSATPNRCSKMGVSWDADVNVRFKPLMTSETDWSLRYPLPNDNAYLTNGWYLNEPGHSLPDPLDLDLQVWMRSAFLPKFRKLLRVIDVDLEPGDYVMNVEEFFDVTTFDGAKGFQLRTSHWIGDGHMEFGIGFIVVGCIGFVIGLSFVLEVFLRALGFRVEWLNDEVREYYVFDPNSIYMKRYHSMLAVRQIDPELLHREREREKNNASDDEEEEDDGVM